MDLNPPVSRIRRSFLVVPADKPERLKKAATLPVDVVVIELEDGVAPENKPKARKTAGRILAEVDFNGRETALRLNRIATTDGLLDLIALAEWGKKPDLVLLPKVESAGEVRIYELLFQEMRVDCELMPLIESARGVQAAGLIATASPKVTALSVAIADLPAELGCQPTWEPMLTIRAAVIIAAGAAGIQAIDPPCLAFRDEPVLIEECKRVRDLGYKGKICIHPSQLEPVNEAFSPTSAEIAQAEKIVAAAADQQGAIEVAGRMVDAPIVKTAQQVLHMANRLGKTGK